MMAGTLRLLIIEDSEDDALLAARELRKGGFDPTVTRVETPQELAAALDSDSWDAVIADFNLPGFTGLDALRAIQAKGLDIPFILVSGTIGEEMAAEVIRAGAHDYISKGNYARLAPSLERALREAEIRHERRQSAEELTRYREHLEEMVQERTVELKNANEALQAEIDKRKQAEATLRESEQRFASFMLHMPAAAWMKDMQGRFVYANAETERVFSTPLTALLGKTDYDFFPPEIARQFGENDCRVLSEGGSLETIEVLRQADGIEHHSLVSKFAVASPDGKPAYIAGVAFDITERKRAEQALQESEERLRLAIDATDLGTFDYYPLTGTMIWSDGVKRHFGLPPDAQVDYGVFLAGLHPDDRERLEGIIQNLNNPESGGEYSTEYRSIGLQDGKERWIAARGRVLYDETGRAVRFVGTTLDISERKQAEEKIEELNKNLAERAGELSRANQELEAFNYSVAHDLRNPLNVISSYCQVINELCGSQLDVHCKEYLQEAYNGTLRMNRLIDALLKFSRLAHVELHRETVDLSAMAQVVAAELKLAEPERRVEFRIAEGVSADGDAAILRVVLDNLLGNAWKYTGMREEGIIEFGATEVDGKPVWFVRDNGAGFDMANAEKLFIPFQRLPGVEKFRGFGVGLATVERIIHRHGGRVWAEGEPGKGATFYFTLANGRE